MYQDLRCVFFNELKTVISEFSTSEELFAKISIILEKYDLTERVTALVPSDDENIQLIKLYTSAILIEGKAKSTINHYVRELKKFNADFCGRSLKDLKPFDIRGYLAKKKLSGISNHTLDNVRAVLSAFYSWLDAEGYVPRNPMINIKPLKYQRELKHPFSPVEIDALRGVCKNEKQRALMEFLLSSGVRVSEFCDLDVSDINFDTCSVHVRHGKGDKERYTYINELTKEHLKNYLKGRTTGPLFLTQRKERYTKGGVQYILHCLGDKVNIPDVHPHRFRRTFATTLASRGMALQEIQKLMGHTNINTTMVYVTLTDQEAKISYAKYS